MTTVVLDIPTFRADFLAFTDETAYPDVLLNTQWQFVTCMMSDTIYSICLFDETCLENALYLMLAHLLYMNNKAVKGKQAGYKISATTDKIAVTFQNVPIRTGNYFAIFLNQSIYGQQLLAMIHTAKAGGMYVGGVPNSQAFRGFAGYYH